MSVLPGGNIPACHPMVATMLGSLMVQARVMTPANSCATIATEAPEPVDRVRVLPAPLGGQPARVGEMVERHDGIDAPIPQALALPPVVGQGAPGELTGRRFDPAPFDGEPVVVEAQAGHQIGVFLPAIPRVAGVSRRFGAGRAGCVLELPPVVVGVPSLDLMGRRRRPPAEPVRKGPTLRSRRHPCRPPGARPSAREQG